MQTDIHQELTRALLADYGFKQQGQWLRKGRCPQCGKKELYVHGDEPWLLKCGRSNKCDWSGHVKDLYLELFEDWGKRSPPTKENPNATADDYMHRGRGFDIPLIKGWYTQGSIFDNRSDAGSATVNFDLEHGSRWERILDNQKKIGDGKGKGRAHGAYKGHWWSAPGVKLEDQKEIWLVEGIFDAIALYHHKITAVATISTVNPWPSIKLKALKETCKKEGKPLPRLVLAFDSDSAGTKATFIAKQKADEEGWVSRAVRIPNRGSYRDDWNDLHQHHKLEEKHIKQYSYLGDLLLADSAIEKALLIYKEKGWRSFKFTYKNSTYWFEYNETKYTQAYEKAEKELEDKGAYTLDDIRDKALQESAIVQLLMRCNVEWLYYQINTVTDEAWYYARIKFPHINGKTTSDKKGAFTSAQVTGSGDFKKRLAHVATGSIWTGNTDHLNRITSHELFGIKTVETIDWIGYSAEHKAYVFNDIAVAGGKLIDINEEDYFELPGSRGMGQLSLKTLAHSPALHINNERDDYTTKWINNIYACFGTQGIVAVAFWLGSLFAEQIREEHKSWPFLEIVGDAGSGKSTLIEFMWKLLGRTDYEGFDPSKSTPAARARNFSQVSCMPVVLIEADSEDKSKRGNFDWDELKTAYNGRATRSRGMKTSGNETYEPPFKAAVVISQNAQVEASEAILQRIVHTHFTREGHTPETKALAEELERWPMEEVSGFVLAATIREKEILEHFNQQMPMYEKLYIDAPEIKTVRIAKNHAQIASMVDCLAKLVGLNSKAHKATIDSVLQLGIERQHAIEDDHPLVQEFWEIFDYINGYDDTGNRLNHSRVADEIAVNLREFAELAEERKQKPPSIKELKPFLKSSKRRAFIESNRTVTSGFAQSKAGDHAKSVRCWVFKNPDIKR